jgi:transposase
MAAIGIDTHKATLAACAVDERGAALAERQFSNDPAGHRALASWAAGTSPGALIGVEGSASYGAALSRTLLASGLAVREVPPHLSRRERIHTRRAGKSDPGDALAIARVTLARGEPAAGAR